MPEPALANGDPRPAKDTLVIAQTQDGYRVYSVHQPSRSFIVKNDGGRWTCTCYDYESRRNDPAWRCRHILAVAPGPVPVPEPEPGPGDLPVPAASGDRDDPVPPAQMLIKRSVSPDGRIDSVSVEFTLSVQGDSQSAIADKAMRTLRLQKEIVGRFLAMHGRAGERHAAPAPAAQPNGHANGKGSADHDGAVTARMIDLTEVQGRWGPRLCLNFQVNGNRYSLFGSVKQIAEHLAHAGCAYDEQDLQPGLRINHFCRIVTKPSRDGKYVNVEEVLPEDGQRNGRAR